MHGVKAIVYYNYKSWAAYFKNMKKKIRINYPI